jgi:hypothetical protein
MKSLFVGGPEHGTVRDLEWKDYSIKIPYEDGEFNVTIYNKELWRSYGLFIRGVDTIDIALWFHISITHDNTSREAFVRDALIRLAVNNGLIDKAH